MYLVGYDWVALGGAVGASPVTTVCASIICARHDGFSAVILSMPLASVRSFQLRDSAGDTNASPHLDISRGARLATALLRRFISLGHL